MKYTAHHELLTGLFLMAKIFQMGIANQISWWWILVPLFLEMRLNYLDNKK